MIEPAVWPHSLAVDYVLRCTPSFRLPEPIRLADHLSRVFRPKRSHQDG
jgi:hypothetical protein